MTLPADSVKRIVDATRTGLEASTRLWLGGAAAAALELPAGVDFIETLERFERQVLLLAAETTP